MPENASIILELEDETGANAVLRRDGIAKLRYKMHYQGPTIWHRIMTGSFYKCWRVDSDRIQIVPFIPPQTKVDREFRMPFEPGDVQHGPIHLKLDSAYSEDLIRFRLGFQPLEAKEPLYWSQILSVPVTGAV